MILASTPPPTPDGGAPDPDLVTPGTIGFLATLAVVILTIFLIRDALRRVRRVRARSGASDAYPIPLRKHVVPNQSKLSGPEAPESKTADSVSEDADSESEGADGEAGTDDASGQQPGESTSVGDEKGPEGLSSDSSA
ncbi:MULTISPECIES: hypothetical protein [unclassified Brevibacterium]|uniref:hypothetical protein n=1 Tax=unclassified Brevibacterium TaxID=2614124 RepID=UPI00197AA687|nr:hypothetical protein [Brevibacterium sp. S22]